MSSAGWFPDPGGAPGRYRYWDGQRWASTTTADPAHAPVPTASPSRTAASGGGSRGWLVALIVLVLVTALAVALVWHWTGTAGPSGGAASEDSQTAKPTISAWDETTPTPTPTPTPSATPTPSRSATPSISSGGGAASLVACPVTRHSASTRQSAGTLSAGGLSADIPSGWRDMGSSSMLFMADQHSVDIYEDANPTHGPFQDDHYVDTIGVGLVFADDGFTDPQTAVHVAMQCLLSGEQWDRPRSTTVVDQATAISGQPAWYVRVNAPRDNQPEGEYIDLVAVTLPGQSDRLAIFYASTAVAWPDHVAAADQARASLRVA